MVTIDEYLRLHPICSRCNESKAERVAYLGSKIDFGYCLPCMRKEFGITSDKDIKEDE